MLPFKLSPTLEVVWEGRAWGARPQTGDSVSPPPDGAESVPLGCGEVTAPGLGWDSLSASLPTPTPPPTATITLPFVGVALLVCDSRKKPPESTLPCPWLWPHVYI